jgi:hypothetical protein
VGDIEFADKVIFNKAWMEVGKNIRDVGEVVIEVVIGTHPILMSPLF